jgi:hypothetical protein
VSPDSLPDDIFRSIGACALRDLGGKWNDDNQKNRV